MMVKGALMKDAWPEWLGQFTTYMAYDGSCLSSPLVGLGKAEAAACGRGDGRQ